MSEWLHVTLRCGDFVRWGGQSYGKRFRSCIGLPFEQIIMPNRGELGVQKHDFADEKERVASYMSIRLVARAQHRQCTLYRLSQHRAGVDGYPLVESHTC